MTHIHVVPAMCLTLATSGKGKISAGATNYEKKKVKQLGIKVLPSVQCFSVVALAKNTYRVFLYPSPTGADGARQTSRGGREMSRGAVLGVSPRI